MSVESITFLTKKILGQPKWLNVGAVPGYTTTHTVADIHKKKTWNIQTQAELNFTGPIGQVYAMVMDNGVLFAGHRNRVLVLFCTRRKQPVLKISCKEGVGKQFLYMVIKHKQFLFLST
ncbi:uncharacterized protein LOC130752710 [Actinidia eriantha]|uniref:uncharacterized protein LOC130752710 n=1 Tax=Actinidia eriantha TaxID=165200 RepID=UPI00258B2B54|nr:uncharacterized protein LOC130752710 [Actinidia eriantha]